MRSKKSPLLENTDNLFSIFSHELYVSEAKFKRKLSGEAAAAGMVLLVTAIALNVQGRGLNGNLGYNTLQ